MITLSKHFFMEVLLRKLHSTIDKYASFNAEGNTILYTTKAQPKVKQLISLAEGKRIFEDLYGPIEERWVVSHEYVGLVQRKENAQARKNKHRKSAR